MGQTAAQMLLRRIQFPTEAYPETVMFEPELMVRESTGAARALPSASAAAAPAPAKKRTTAAPPKKSRSANS
jgi:hypothetical protein